MICESILWEALLFYRWEFEREVSMKNGLAFCSEVTREDVHILCLWMKDPEVTRFLSDYENVSEEMQRMLQRVNLPVVTHLFNQNGRFYMVYDKADRAIGFVRTIKSGTCCEIVVVIGNRKNWNKRVGTGMVQKILQIAFLEERMQKVTAKIDNDNVASICMCAGAGMLLERENEKMKIFSLTIDQYLNLLKGIHMTSHEIYVTRKDTCRLGKMLADVNNREKEIQSVSRLEKELSRAVIVNSERISDKVVTMNSKAVIAVEEDEFEISLVYPWEADPKKEKISVLSPVGTAILGYKEGDCIQWEIPSGPAVIRIKKMIYQPEKEGIYEL